ncbi:MAG TPA: response regulator transcription factor [Candidatus Limnocylindria bacterium]|jgi:DNA-binding NarL/FixJ family response regulator|nr:response regulator transcription factor [Candidatus Limnocylindria bacterium]
MNSKKPISILLSEDQQIVREGLRVMLDLEPDFEVVAEAQDGRQAVALAIRHEPAVVLMDIAMPQLNGLEATRQICRALPGTRVIMLSAHSSEEHVGRATEAGAAGFLLKHEVSIHDVYRAIREVEKGRTHFSPLISRRIDRLRSQSPGNATASAGKRCELTLRQSEVLQCVAESRANKQIADDLGIDIKTVEKHRKNLMEKLNIHDTAGLTRYAISAGVIECDVSLSVV